MADPEKKLLLDILPSRNSEELYQYFSQFSIQERNQVRYVVMDMSIAFKSIMKTCFPKAQIVADKFHVCRQV